jgi:hypothetical protein
MAETTSLKKVATKALEDAKNHKTKQPKPTWDVQTDLGSIESINRLIKNSPAGSKKRQEYIDQKNNYEQAVKDWEAENDKYDNAAKDALKAYQDSSKLDPLIKKQQDNKDTGVVDTKLDEQVTGLKESVSIATKPKSVNQGTPMRPVGAVTPKPEVVVTPKGGKGGSGSSGNTGSGAGNTGTGGSGKGDTTPKDVKAPPTQQEFLAKYQVQLALINSNPELKALLKQAMDGNWDAGRWTLEFANSAWATNHAKEWQLSETERLTAPATYAARWNRNRERIARLAVQAGVEISPEQLGVELATDGSSVSRGDGTITQWWMDQKDNNPSDEAITAHLAFIGKINLQLPGGKAAGYNMALREYAGQMGINNLALPPSDNVNGTGKDWFSDAALSILLGKSTKETWQADILKRAKDTYGAFAPALDAGQTVRNIAAPYINTLANLLEIPIDQIDLGALTGYGKMVRDALIGMDPANQKPMALYDFEKQVKGRSEWGKTNNARDTIMGGVNDLLKSFGKVSG